MEMSEVRQLASRPSYLSPTKGPDGAWASAGAHALRAALRAKSPGDVMALLHGMDGPGMAVVLREAGFPVRGVSIGESRDTVFAHAKPALQRALTRGTDGWALAAANTQSRARSVRSLPAAAKAAMDAPAAPSTALAAMSQDATAEEMVRQILSASVVRVVPLGEQPFHARASLQMVAAQALQQRVAGFGFDGVGGKFDVPASMAQVLELHREAASAFAVQSTRASLKAWASGSKVVGLSDWVPDSVQRLLHGSVSLQAAEVVVSSISSGSLARHAGEFGASGISELLAAKGLDVHAPTIEQQAAEMGLKVKAPDVDRGQYFGEVVSRDHRASLIKVNRSDALELPHTVVEGAQTKVGDQLRLNFKAGALTVSKAARIGRNAPSL